MVIEDKTVYPIQLHTGDILFLSGKSIISKIIRKVTNSKYSHVAIIASVDYENKTALVAEALVQGFYMTQMTFKEIFNKFDIGRVTASLSKSQRDTVRSTILKWLGKRYGFLNIIRLFKMIILKEPYTQYDGLKTLICSEAVQRVYEEIGITLVDKEPDTVTPADISKSKEITVKYTKK